VKATEFSSGPDYVKALVIGASGAGKSILASTFPGTKFYADFDNKISSTIKFHLSSKDILEKIEFEPYGKIPIKPSAGKKSRMQTFLDDMKKWCDLQNAGKPLPFQTLIIDTITTMGDSLLEDYREVSQLGVKRPNKDQNSQSDYGLFGNHIRQIVTPALALDCHVVIIGHTRPEKDELTGIVTNQIMFPGAFSEKIGLYFEEVYFAKVDKEGKHMLQTKADSKTPMCKTARKLPAEIPAHFSEIIKAR